MVSILKRLKFNKQTMWYTLVFSVTILKLVNSFQPEFVEPIVNISVAVGRDATFTCHVRHLGGYRIGWVKADTKAIQAIHDHVVTHNQRVSVSHSDANTWNLHIKSVSTEDRGGYMCQMNTDPMKSQIGYLDVVIPPDFIDESTSSDVIVPEGSSVQLKCRATGHPEPTVTWRREDGTEIVLKDNTGIKQLVTTYRGEVLKLTKISRSEMGSYLCIASNGVPPTVSKRISLNIHFHPVIQVQNQLIGAPFGTNVVLECHVEAFPKSINYWIKDTGEMIASSPKYRVQEVSKSPYETRMTLIVQDFNKDNLGTYKCIAKNSLGEVDSSIRLYEIPGPNKKQNNGKQPVESNEVIIIKNQNEKTTYRSMDEDDQYSAEDRIDYEDGGVYGEGGIRIPPNQFGEQYGNTGSKVGKHLPDLTHKTPHNTLNHLNYNSNMGLNLATRKPSQIWSKPEIRSTEREISSATGATVSLHKYQQRPFAFNAPILIVNKLLWLMPIISYWLLL